MGLFSFLKKMNNSDKSENENTVLNTSLKHEREVIVEPFPFSVEKKSLFDLTERQYESLYDRFDNALDKFEDVVSELEAEFECESFDYNQRVKLMKKACKAFDRCFNIAAPYWYEDYLFMKDLNLEEPNKWTKKQFDDIKPEVVTAIDDNPEIYNFMNINFLRWLLEKYEENPEELKPLLKEKEFQRLCKEYGSEEKALEELEWRAREEKFKKEYPKFKKKVKLIIIENPDILQKDIKTYFPDEMWHKHIGTVIKEWEKEGKVTKVKSGNTYKISWNEGAEK